MATNKRPTMLRLPEELFIKIKRLSDIEHRSLNMEIEYALMQYIEQYENNHGIIPVDSDDLYQ